MNQGNERTAREKKTLSPIKVSLGRRASVRRAFGSFGLFALCLFLSACSETVTPPPPGNNTDTGSLQVTITGLPPEAKANVTVTGPDDYEQRVERSGTLTGLPTGRYTVSVDSIVYAGETYPGSLPGSRDQRELDVTRQAVGEVTVSYASVGVVGEGDIAPGVTRTGTLSTGAFRDYTFTGVEGVPLAFSFAGTREAGSATYNVSIFRPDNLETPLQTERFGTANSYPYAGGNPTVGFTPSEGGPYVLRAAVNGGELSYTVRASYLSGTPEEHQEVTPLEAGKLVLGAVTENSVDRYRFSATADEALTLAFDYEEGGAIYLVEVLDEDGTEPLYSKRVGTANGLRRLEFTPPMTGDYLVRVTGENNVLRYNLVLEK